MTNEIEGILGIDLAIMFLLFQADEHDFMTEIALQYFERYWKT